MKPLPFAAVAFALLLAGCAQTGLRGSDAGAGAGSSTGPEAGSASCDPLGKPLGACGCPDHWHATFALFVRDGTTLHRIDWSIPRAPSGRPYYDFGVASGMSLKVHMHQSGFEAGSQALGPSQLHYEGGRCASVAESLAAVDAALDAEGARLSGPLGESQGTRWTGPLSVYLESWDPSVGNWTWRKVPWNDVQGMQLGDGQALLLTVGDMSPAEVSSMERQVPPPMSRRDPSPP